MPQTIDKKLLRKVALVVKELRLAENLTQEDVYNETNIHIARIETGNYNITISTLAAICKYFKISLSDFHKRIEHL